MTPSARFGVMKETSPPAAANGTGIDATEESSGGKPPGNETFTDEAWRQLAGRSNCSSA